MSNKEESSFNDLIDDVKKIIDTKFEKPIKKISDSLNDNNSELDETKKKKEKEKISDLDKAKNEYDKNVEDLIDFIVSFFKEIESILLQIASGNIGIHLAKSLLKLGVLITKIAKFYSSKQFKLNGIDKIQFVGLHRRLFTFNRTFLVNSLARNLSQKQIITKKLNTK
jgi:hypothetical protein